MNTLAALWYLDASRARTALKELVRKPSRLWLWVLLALWLGLTYWRHSPGSNPLFPDLAEPFATLVGGAVIAFFGFTLASTASLGRVSAFSNPVDVYFFARSSLDERVVAFWLQVRNFAVTFGRSALFLVVAVLYYAHSHVAGATIGLFGTVALLEALRLPAALLERKAPRLKWAFYGMAIAGAAVAFCAVGALAWPSLSTLQTASESLGFGRAILTVWHGDLAALLVLYASAFLALLIGVALSGDIYPEMYSSARYIDTARARMRRGNIGIPISTRTSRSASTSLRGPWVEIWKQLAFVRRGNGVQISSLIVGGALLLGIVAGLAARRDPSFGFTIGTTALLAIVIFLAMRGVSLAADLSKPLWWMGDGSTFAKLIAWTIGSSLPAIVFLSLVAVVAGAIADPDAIAVLLLIAITVPLSTRALGVFTYVLMPSAIDQRGPGNIVRMLLIYVLLVPALAGGIACSILLSSANAGYLAGLSIYLGESALALGFAARRIAGRGVEFALAESS